MADDRSLKDIIRFVDPSGEISDADIASLTSDLKFTEVLDLISYVGKDDMTSARDILAKYDPRFSTGAEEPSSEPTEEQITQEYSQVPVAKKPAGFKPIKPVPTIAGKPVNPNPSQQPAQQADNEEPEDVNAVLNDPMNRNRPEVKQIQSLLQRMKR